jgi:glycosyltransferase involved in cell wall biosynthesis
LTVECSVVVPTHNRAHLVVRALRTVLAQRDVEVEVVVVDDGSRDDTAEAVAALGDSRVRLLRNERPLGVANARNRGIEAAVAPWVAFCDDDDVWAPGKLAAQTAALSRVAGAGWSSAGAVTVDEALHLSGPGVHPPADGDVASMLLVRNAIPGGASSVMARTALVRDVGGFDPALSVSADFDLWIRLALASPHAGADEPLVGYLVRAGSMAHDVARHVRNLRLIEQRYAGERAARDVSFGWQSYLRFIGANQLRGGHRFAAARAHLRLALAYRDREARSLLWRGLVAPRRVQAKRDARESAGVTAAWRTAADAWLSSLRTAAGR